MFSSLVWSHSSCKYPCLFRFVVFQYFHSYDVSYFMLIRVFVILLFSVTVFNNVSSLFLVKFEIRVISVCGYTCWGLFSCSFHILFTSRTLQNSHVEAFCLRKNLCSWKNKKRRKVQQQQAQRRKK